MRDTPTGQPELDRAKIIPREVGSTNWKWGNSENNGNIILILQRNRRKRAGMDLTPKKWDQLVYLRHSGSIHCSPSHCAILGVGIPSRIFPFQWHLGRIETRTMSGIFTGKRWRSGIPWLS